MCYDIFGCDIYIFRRFKVTSKFGMRFSHICRDNNVLTVNGNATIWVLKIYMVILVLIILCFRDSVILYLISN